MRHGSGDDGDGGANFTAFRSRFGFRFVVFVDGRSKREIVKVLKERLNNDRDQELATGLRAVVDIARSRLEKEKAR